MINTQKAKLEKLLPGKHLQSTSNYNFKRKQELIRRWDSERDLFYDHIIQYIKI